ncbi:serine hydrolase domain-containing protein [Draconibacterium orientale]|uniref:serine hydrolase domain-containing protein n=1 Tax=Draconibacterium orientale TaxID=1168034 RepID=UPI002ABE40C6|nr:serine hydrolase domain-containing protein [Draconibacterium orientale]
MKTKFLFLSILSFVTIFLISCSNDDDPITISEYTDATTFFNELDYSGSVLISKNGSDILRTGFGMANKNTAEPNTTGTRFRIGSVSKTLTGMGIVQLKRDGLINSFDQALSDFDDSFPHGNQITLRHLLSHQSGLPDYVSMVESDAKSGQTFTPETIFEIVKNQVAENNLIFTPGSSVAYSNTNFLILALLIEELSGDSYENYITSKILDPLNMADTEMGSNEINGENYAQGYYGNENVSEYPMQITFGAGCWTSTVADLEKWCRAAMGNSWFSPDEKNVIFGEDVPEESTAFKLAWFRSKIDGKTFLWHGGDIDGFASLIGFVPESNSVLISLSNKQDDSGTTRNKIIETILKNEL